MKVFTIQFTEDELTELENVLDQHVYAEAIENKGSEGTIGTIHNRILDVHYQNNIYDVLINYIKGDKDRKGFIPTENFTILINNNGKRITCHDYKLLEIIAQWKNGH